jgi:membrane protein implicated in regulation of membrane protease activity
VAGIVVLVVITVVIVLLIKMRRDRKKKEKELEGSFQPIGMRIALSKSFKRPMMGRTGV